MSKKRSSKGGLPISVNQVNQPQETVSPSPTVHAIVSPQTCSQSPTATRVSFPVPLKPKIKKSNASNRPSHSQNNMSKNYKSIVTTSFRSKWHLSNKNLKIKKLKYRPYSLKRVNSKKTKALNANSSEKESVYCRKD